MSASESIDTSCLVEVRSARGDRVFVRDLTDETLQMAFDNWWKSMDVKTKHTIVWKTSRHAASWAYYKHCANAENGSPGIICIVCHQVLAHPSENGTSTMGKHLLTKVHTAKLSELTEQDRSLLTTATAGERALAVLKKKGSHGVMVVSLRVHYCLYQSTRQCYCEKYKYCHSDRFDRRNARNWRPRTSQQWNSTKRLGIVT